MEDAAYRDLPGLAGRDPIAMSTMVDTPMCPVGHTTVSPMGDITMSTIVDRAMLPMGNRPSTFGLTPGELARWLVGAGHVRATVGVVPVRGYRRSHWYDETGIPWVAPSPNIRDLETALLYPGLAFVEATSVRPMGEEQGWIGRIHRRTDVGALLDPDHGGVG